MTYDELYSDSFDILLRSLDHNPDYSDSLYTRAYIALKTAQDEPSAMRVISKVDSLVKIDGNKENVMNYLKMRCIALGILNKETNKDKNWVKKQFINTNFQMYNLYPSNSTDRLAGLGMLYKAIGKEDSANYYLTRSIHTSERLIRDGNAEDRLKGSLAKLTGLLLLKSELSAKTFLSQRIKAEGNPYNKDALISIENHWEEYEGQIFNLLHMFDEL